MNMIIWYLTIGIIVTGINLIEIKCIDPKSWKEFNGMLDDFGENRAFFSILWMIFLAITWPMLLKDMIVNAIRYYKGKKRL